MVINPIDYIGFIEYAVEMRRSSASTPRRSSTRIDPAAIARSLAPAIRWPGPAHGAAASERCWHLLAGTPEFDAWVIAWPEASGVTLHDHGISGGAIAVIEGDLVETTPWREDSGRLSLVRRVLRTGAVLELERGRVHDVSNANRSTAVSLHVYSPPLTSMTHYDLVEGVRLEPSHVRSARDWEDLPPSQPDEVLCRAG